MVLGEDLVLNYHQLHRLLASLSDLYHAPGTAKNLQPCDQDPLRHIIRYINLFREYNLTASCNP